MAPPAYGSDVEVQYDGNGNGNNPSNPKQTAQPQSSNNVGDKYIDFENVFDPFERDADDVREFFDDTESSNLVDLDDMEDNNNRIFYDPKQVRVVFCLFVCLFRVRRSFWSEFCNVPRSWFNTLWL